jgi:hypothetical protein
LQNILSGCSSVPAFIWGAILWHPGTRLNSIDKDTHTNKLQLIFWKTIKKNSKVKRAWLEAMGDRPGSPSRVRMSEDKVRINDMCWSVGIFLGS